MTSVGHEFGELMIVLLPGAVGTDHLELPVTAEANVGADRIDGEANLANFLVSKLCTVVLSSRIFRSGIPISKGLTAND